MHISKKIYGYKKSFDKFGDDPRSLQWNSRESAEIRYKQLVEDIDFHNKTVLDVGCGFGDIISFIKAKSKEFYYTGVDVVPEFIKTASEKYPAHKFTKRDYFGNPMQKKFDIILTSGTLNSSSKNAILYRKKAIKTLWEHTNQVLAFNMAGGYPQPESKKGGRVFYANSLEVLQYCLEFTSKLIFKHHYHKKDFTVIMYK